MIKFSATIKGNKLTIDNQELFKRHLDQLRLKTKPETKVTITVKRRYGNRSLSQNNYYWGVIIAMLSEEFGTFPEETHFNLKRKFLRVGGSDDFPRVRSTTTLSTIEWEELMTKIRQWAMADYNIKIPSVDDYYKGIN